MYVCVCVCLCMCVCSGVMRVRQWVYGVRPESRMDIAQREREREREREINSKEDRR